MLVFLNDYLPTAIQRAFIVAVPRLLLNAYTLNPVVVTYLTAISILPALSSASAQAITVGGDLKLTGNDTALYADTSEPTVKVAANPYCMSGIEGNLPFNLNK